MTYYEDLVIANYCSNYYAAMLALEEEVKPVADFYSQILNGGDIEVDKGDPAKFKEKVSDWNTNIESIITKSMELKEKIKEQYDKMIEKARVFDAIYNGLNEISRENPFEPLTNGLTTYEYSITNVSRDTEGYPCITLRKTTIEYENVLYKESDEGYDASNPNKVKEKKEKNRSSVENTYSIKTMDELASFKANPKF